MSHKYEPFSEPLHPVTLPSQEGTIKKGLPETQGQNLAVTVLHVPYLLDSETPGFGCGVQSLRSLKHGRFTLCTV